MVYVVNVVCVCMSVVALSISYLADPLVDAPTLALAVVVPCTPLPLLLLLTLPVTLTCVMEVLRR